MFSCAFKSGSFFQEIRTVSEAHCQFLKVTFPAEYIDRKTDIKDSFACEYILANAFDDECEDFFLFVHFLLIDVIETTGRADCPLAFPDVVSTEVGEVKGLFGFLAWSKVVLGFEVGLWDDHGAV